MPVYTERSAGTYRAKYLGCVERMMTNTDTQEEEPRWIWRFQEVSDPTSAGQIDKITNTSMKSANSNAYKMAAGILGHKPRPGDDTEKHIGEVYDVWYGPNQAGNLTIVGVAGAQSVASLVDQGKTKEAAVLIQDDGAADFAAEESDQLPF